MMFVVGEYQFWYGGGAAENIQTEMKEHKLEYGMQSELHIETEKKLVSVKKLNWEFIGERRRKKKLSTKPIRVCSGKVFTTLVCGGGGVVDIK